ncbi:hypothetical protein MSAN_01770300 [Mycena sanguinolenta]|uniref:Uncharacterized protein n=1 Tax=Mycena sanguinolenta TaxID=230812 RepID=A0A8H7CS14_9AGAR|nr:hypothetical protein MSAN_01770300 [Mycena sanguinolenta]
MPGDSSQHELPLPLPAKAEQNTDLDSEKRIRFIFAFHAVITKIDTPAPKTETPYEPYHDISKVPSARFGFTNPISSTTYPPPLDFNLCLKCLGDDKWPSMDQTQYEYLPSLLTCLHAAWALDDIPRELLDLRQSEADICVQSNWAIAVTREHLNGKLFYVLRPKGLCSEDCSIHILLPSAATTLQNSDAAFEIICGSNLSFPSSEDTLVWAIVTWFAESFFLFPRGRAALFAGGIIGRLAREDVLEVLACQGPSSEVFTSGVRLWDGHSSMAYWDYGLSEEEIDLICGVYEIGTGQRPGQTPRTTDSTPSTLILKLSMKGASMLIAILTTTPCTPAPALVSLGLRPPSCLRRCAQQSCLGVTLAPAPPLLAGGVTCVVGRGVCSAPSASCPLRACGTSSLPHPIHPGGYARPATTSCANTTLNYLASLGFHDHARPPSLRIHRCSSTLAASHASSAVGLRLATSAPVLACVRVQAPHMTTYHRTAHAWSTAVVSLCAGGVNARRRRWVTVGCIHLGPACACGCP